MKAPPSPDVRKGPGRGLHAKFTAVKIGNRDTITEALSGQLGSGRDAQNSADLDADIAVAEEYERYLALKAYRVRKLILNLMVKRDALDALGAALMERRAA